MDELRRLRAAKRTSLKQLLPAKQGRARLVLLPRGKARRRAISALR